MPRYCCCKPQVPLPCWYCSHIVDRCRKYIPGTCYRTFGTAYIPACTTTGSCTGFAELLFIHIILLYHPLHALLRSAAASSAIVCYKAIRMTLKVPLAYRRIDWNISIRHILFRTASEFRVVTLRALRQIENASDGRWVEQRGGSSMRGGGVGWVEGVGRLHGTICSIPDPHMTRSYGESISPWPMARTDSTKISFVRELHV